MKYKALSIAGFDGSGGAGLQADLKTFGALGCYGMTVLTALPIQNTCGVRNCYQIPISAIEEQLEAIFDDITPDAIKIGMLFSSDIIKLVANFLQSKAKNIPIVLDPVMVAKSGDRLLQEDAISALRQDLLPLATIVTPNIPEANCLLNLNKDLQTEEFAVLADKILKLGPKSVLIKGGHLNGVDSNDLLLTQDGISEYFVAKRIETKNSHGTGCTLSAAITSYLAKSFDLITSCKKAKEYLTAALLSAKNLSVGKGHGPVNHFYQTSETD